MHVCGGQIDCARSFSFLGSHSVYESIEKRFLLLIVFFPLCLGTTLTSIVVYERMFTDVVMSYVRYVFCLDDKSSSKPCPQVHRRCSSVMIAVMDLFVFNVFNVVLIAFTLLPPPVRAFWRKAVTCCLRKVNTTKKEGE